VSADMLFAVPNGTWQRAGGHPRVQQRGRQGRRDSRRNGTLA